MGWFILWVVMAIICAMIASSKGRSAVGFFFYGFLIWPIALVHALIMQPAAKAVENRAKAQGRLKCPFCAEMILREAKVCPHCRKNLPAHWWESGVSHNPPGTGEGRG